MCFNIHIPDEAGNAFHDVWGKDVDRVALESMVMEAYRRGKMSTGCAAKLLGMGVIECLDWMSGKGVHQPPPTMEEVERDAAKVRALLGTEDSDRRAGNVP
ncbi:MAG TPA: UPF0175 family protein [Phycisphaerales bacterium]|nr:UPF0175 family protein [Phycisphaerales bacterium]